VAQDQPEKVIGEGVGRLQLIQENSEGQHLRIPIEGTQEVPVRLGDFQPPGIEPDHAAT